MHKSSGHSSSSSSRSSLNSSMTTPGWNESLIFKLPTDEELRKEGTESLLKRLRFMEVEMKKILAERNHIIKDTNQCIQHNGLKIRKLDEFNQRLTLEKKMLLFEKEELKGLCCFLDDDRSKANKVAREWQMFGRYATSYLQKEVASYQNKIKDLEQRQIALIHENKSLKEICFDHETTGSFESNLPTSSHLSVSCTRDSGDGSSNGSTTGSSSPDHRSSSRPTIKDSNLYSADPAQGTRYIRYLEHKVRHLEEESKGRIKIVQANPDSSKRSSSSSSSSVPTTTPTDLQTQQPVAVFPPSTCEPRLSKVVHSSPKTLLKSSVAPKTLKSAPNESQDQHLDEKERANVQNVCSTVWKKFLTTNQQSYLPNKPRIPKTPSISDL